MAGYKFCTLVLIVTENEIRRRIYQALVHNDVNNAKIVVRYDHRLEFRSELSRAVHF